MLRWALVEGIQRQPAWARPRQVKDAIIARRGNEVRGIAKTAAARIMLTQVFYGLRDGHVRPPRTARRHDAAGPAGRAAASLVFPAAAGTAGAAAGTELVIGPARP